MVESRHAAVLGLVCWEHTMLVALLAVLGVNLYVLLALLVGVLARRRWVSRRAGAFAGVIRVSSGEHHGLGSKWRRGYGYWVRHVLVWTKKPFLFRNQLVAVDRLENVRRAREGETKRLADEPAVADLVADDVVIQIATSGSTSTSYSARFAIALPSTLSLAGVSELTGVRAPPNLPVAALLMRAALEDSHEQENYR